METIHRLIKEGSLLKALFFLGWPIMVTSLLQSAYNLADTFWVGRLGTIQGAESIAALSLVWPVVWLMMSFAQGAGMAGVALVSQNIGAGDHARANRIAGEIFAMFLTFSVIVSIIGFIGASHMVDILSPPGPVNDRAAQYLRIIFLGQPFMFITIAFTFLLRGYGDTKTPMYVNLVSVCINIVLDPIFIFGYGLDWGGFGFIGVAYATVFSRAIAAILAAFILFKGSKGISLTLQSLKPVKEDVMKILRVAIPSSIGGSGAALGFVVISALVARVGDGMVPLAALGIGNRVTSMIFIVIIGLSMSLATIVGQNLGANNVERAERAGKLAMVLMFGILGVASLILWLVREPLIGIFTDNPEVIAEGSRFLFIFALFMPFFGVFRAVGAVYNGSGHTKYTMALSLLRLWGLRVPLIVLLVFLLAWGPVGIWWAMGISNVVAGAIAVGFFYWGKWKTPIEKPVIARVKHD
ncbi:MAG TPA: MATE family efflux transporter [Euryarchaeota archaeon]|nr:MATE family efflux transporter [Euryarchaeota archaeon]